MLRAGCGAVLALRIFALAMALPETRDDAVAAFSPGLRGRHGVLLIAAMGEQLSGEERAIFQRLTGREREPPERVEELWVVIGRRGGKTRAAAVLASYAAGLCDHSGSLAVGERGLVLFIAQNQRQAAVAFGY